MSPQVMEQINKAIYEVTSEETQVRIAKSRKDGIKEGIKEGIEKGVVNTTKNMIKKLKKFHTSEEIAEMLDLDVDYVNEVN